MYHCAKCPNTELFLVLKVTIKNAYFFVLIVLCLRTHLRKIFLHWTTNGKVFNTMVLHDFNMTSFSPCCHNWLACICFCVRICLLPRVFCFACYCLCVEQWLAFHWDIGDILWKFGYMICRFPKFPRICSRFCLLILLGVISDPYFPVFSPNTGKYGPEITPFLDTFHVVYITGRVWRLLIILKPILTLE